MLIEPNIISIDIELIVFYLHQNVTQLGCNQTSRSASSSQGILMQPLTLSWQWPGWHWFGCLGSIFACHSPLNRTLHSAWKGVATTVLARAWLLFLLSPSPAPWNLVLLACWSSCFGVQKKKVLEQAAAYRNANRSVCFLFPCFIFIIVPCCRLM